MLPPVRVAVVPIYRRHWLYYAWLDGVVETPLQQPVVGRAPTLGERLDITRQNLSAKFTDKVRQQWNDMKAAPSGTFKNWLYRAAMQVLSWEDPTEQFLKLTPPPADVSDVEIIFPASLPETQVRRTLRLLARHRIHTHRRWLAASCVGILPLLPLIVTPLPNIPLYYVAYRLYSHHAAWTGAQCLLDLLDHQNAVRLAQLRSDLMALRAQGVPFPPDTWSGQLVRNEQSYRDRISRAMTTIRRHLDRSEHTAFGDLMITFSPSPDLDRLVRPRDRDAAPLSDAAAVALGEHLAQPDLLQQVAKLRKQALGSPFPVLDPLVRR